MQNKANFVRFSPKNDVFTKKQTQNKPNLSQFQSQTNPICRRAKMNAFAWLETWIAILVNLLADLTTLKGANTKPIWRKG
jgi:hypothetical protein